MSEIMQSPDESRFIIYQSESGETRLEVRLQHETVWLTQSLMAELYQTTKQNISLHIQNIYEEGELLPEATVKEYLTVRIEGSRTVKRPLDYYNLDMIIAVGYRVRSAVATAFRQWATARLSEYIVKGFTLDDERLKGGGGLVDYFDELLDRIREIRASEARVYQRIREIFKLARDYREGEEETQLFFATMQNKMHYAATGMTAAEIVRRRADADEPNMGLTSWQGSRVLKRDINTAKNYLDAREINLLNRITVMFLDQAEFRVLRRQHISMHDWEGFLDKFLSDTELPVLSGAGRVKHDDAREWAGKQYGLFVEKRRLQKESEAEARYMEDLRTSAEKLESQRDSKPRQNKKNGKNPNQGEQRKNKRNPE